MSYPIEDLMKKLICPPDWSPCTTKQQTEFADQLHLEAGEGHPLCNRRCRALLFSGLTDDVLFRTDDIAYPLAYVHLTWRPLGRDPDFPFTRLFASIDEWNKFTKECEI